MENLGVVDEEELDHVCSERETALDRPLHQWEREIIHHHLRNESLKAVSREERLHIPGFDKVICFSFGSHLLDLLIVKEITAHTVSHVTLLVSSGKFMSGSAFFLSPPENKKAKFAFCTLKRKGGSTQKQPFLTVRFRGALLTKSVTLEFSQGTV